MASHWKHFSFGLRSLFLSLALLLGGILVHAQEAAVAPAPADSKPASDADFIAAADEVLGQMSQITGLKVLAPLKKSLRSREEIRAYVIKQMNEEKNPAERYADLRSAEAFGLLPKGFDLDSFMVNVLTEQVEGLYDPKTREFYIADWSPLADQRMVMAHELTHALEDQHFHIESWVKAARPNEDAELARDAVLEGNAMAAMVDYLMLIILAKSNIGRRSVRHKIGSGFNVFPNKSLQGPLFGIWYNGCMNFFPALENSQYNGLILWSVCSNSPCSLIGVHVLFLSADESLIHFDFVLRSADLVHWAIAVIFLHAQTDAMQHEPCGLLSDAKSAAYFIGTYAVLAVRNQPNSDKPLVQGQG